jgi:hypothetical protein
MFVLYQTGSRLCGVQSNSRYFFPSKTLSSRILICSNLYVHRLEIVYTATSLASGCSANSRETLLEGIIIEGGSCDNGGSKLAADFLAA